MYVFAALFILFCGLASAAVGYLFIVGAPHLLGPDRTAALICCGIAALLFFFGGRLFFGALAEIRSLRTPPFAEHGGSR